MRQIILIILISLTLQGCQAKQLEERLTVEEKCDRIARRYVNSLTTMQTSEVLACIYVQLSKIADQDDIFSTQLAEQD